MQYWTPGTKQRNLLSDGILWSVRPQTEKEINVLSKVNDAEIAHYPSWRHYRQVMEGGGLTGDMNAAQAVKAFKVTWIHFARHKSLQKQDMVQQ